MKKIIPILVVIALVLSGLGVGAASLNKATEKTESVAKKLSYSISFQADPEFKEENNFLRLGFEGANTYLKFPGEPELPVYTKSFQIPSKASNIEVRCTECSFKSLDLTKEIIPVAKYVIQDVNRRMEDIQLEKNENIYSSSAWYPEELYSYRVTCGRNEDNLLVGFIHMQINPVQYSPRDNKVRFVNGDLEIQITYNVPKEKAVFEDEYDLIIIAPEEFSGPFGPLKRLVDHKNRLGMKTILKTVEDINEEFEGRDKPEKIKYFIKDAIEEWNISYVLLVGGLKSYENATDREDANQGSTDWWVPVRYTNIDLYEQFNPEVPPDEPGCLSDLYYADIFKEGQVFDDWDSNGNGIFAEADTDLQGHSDIKDVLDLNPDVYVGRLACRNKLELRILVNKIINYERTSPNSKRWFNTMIVIAGKTFGFYSGMPDGEYVCEKALEYMDDLVEPKKLYVSNNDTGGPRPIPQDIERAIRRGAGFVDFQGHGNPIKWDTIWADGSYPKDWAGGLLLFDFWKLFNFRKLPVVVIGGCHNGLFNVTLEKTGNHTKYPYYWTHGVSTPVCFAWGMNIIPWGGSIATIAGTGLGIGPGSGTPVKLSAELETNFFYQIGQEDANTLGQAHSGAIIRYLDNNPDYRAIESHCITTYSLLGDPSLMIGGYK